MVAVLKINWTTCKECHPLALATFPSWPPYVDWSGLELVSIILFLNEPSSVITDEANMPAWIARNYGGQSDWDWCPSSSFSMSQALSSLMKRTCQPGLQGTTVAKVVFPQPRPHCSKEHSMIALCLLWAPSGWCTSTWDYYGRNPWLPTMEVEMNLFCTNNGNLPCRRHQPQLVEWQSSASASAAGNGFWNMKWK